MESNIECLVTLSKDVMMKEVLRQLVLALQGIGGEIFLLDKNSGIFTIFNQVADLSVRQQAERAAVLGTLHYRVRRMAEEVTLDSPLCLIGLAWGMKVQLNDFIFIFAQLDTQLHISISENRPLTLLSIYSLLRPHKTRLHWLAIAAENCRHKRGGALLTTLQNMMQHGDPRAKAWLQPLLAAASRPFYQILLTWMSNGELYDPHEEFFVASNNSNATEAVKEVPWSNWYLRYDMLPCFVSPEQARLVLLTGKSVWFLRCLLNTALYKDMPNLRAVEAVLTEATKTESGVALWASKGRLQACISAAERSISRQLMMVLLRHCKLAEHLEGLMNYMLLADGSFCMRLMENLAPYLELLETELPTSRHLQRILERALENAKEIISTNKEHEVLRCVEVLYKPAEVPLLLRETFTLTYNLPYPINMMVPKSSAAHYGGLFSLLWHTRCMDGILMRLWSRQINASRSIRIISVEKEVRITLQMLGFEMLHLVRHLHSYFIEGIELLWSAFRKFFNSSSVTSTSKVSKNPYRAFSPVQIMSPHVTISPSAYLKSCSDVTSTKTTINKTPSSVTSTVSKISSHHALHKAHSPTLQTIPHFKGFSTSPGAYNMTSSTCSADLSLSGDQTISPGAQVPYSNMQVFDAQEVTPPFSRVTYPPARMTFSNDHMTTMDEVIRQHEHFLEKTLYHCLMNKESEGVLSMVRSVLGSVARLGRLEEELEAMTKDYKVVDEKEEKNFSRVSNNNCLILMWQNAAHDLQSLSCTYRDKVRCLLNLLSSNPREELQALSCRLDMSGFYNP